MITMPWYLLALYVALGIGLGGLIVLMMLGRKMWGLIAQSRERSAELDLLRGDLQRALISSPWSGP